MAQAEARNKEWTEGWGVVRQVHEVLEFVAFFETQEAAKAAANEQPGCQACWLTYRTGFWLGRMTTAATSS
jgi:hypothetical protein